MDRRWIGSLGLSATLALSAWADVPIPVLPTPPASIPPAENLEPLAAPKAAPAQAVPPAATPAERPAGIARVEPAGSVKSPAADRLAMALNQAQVAHSQLRDYAGHWVRQERIGGKLAPEQVVELRVRIKPYCVNTRIAKPDALRGEETSYMADRVRTKVKFKPAGIEGVKGFQTLAVNDPKVNANTTHPITDVGLEALLTRVNRILNIEQNHGHPVTVIATDYVFAGKPVDRYELIADISHIHRYAARCVIYFDKATKFPIRFEAYNAPQRGEKVGELIEAQSLVNLITNVGLGNPAFER